MPNTLENRRNSLFEFDELVEPPLFQFDDVISLGGEPPEEDSLQSRLRKLIEDSGFANVDSIPLPKAKYGSVVPSSLSVAGVEGVESPVPMGKNGEPLSPLNDLFSKISETLIRNPVATHVSPAGAAITATGSALAGMLEPGLESDKYQPGQSLGKTAVDVTINAGKSFARLGTSLAYLPEAMATDPSAVVEGLVKFIPEQAAMLYKAVWPAETLEEQAEQRAAREQLYEDPLGPVFAAMMAGGVAKLGTAATKSLKANASKYRIARGFKKNLEAAERIAGEMPPVGPALSAELPAGVAGLLPDYSKMAVPVPPKPKGRLVPPAPGVEQEFGAVARPTGEATLFMDVPESTRSLGTAPLGNFMTFLKRLEIESKKGHIETAKPTMTTKMGAIESIGAADMSRLARLDPPKYNPLLRSGIKADPSLVLDVNPIDAIPDVPIHQWDTGGWIKRTGDRVSRVFDFIKTHEGRIKSPESKELVNQFRNMNRSQHRHLGDMAENFREIGLLYQREGPIPALQRKIKGIDKMKMEEFMQVPGVRENFVQIGERLKTLGAQIIMPDGSITPFDLSEEFLRTGPIRMKYDVLKKIWDDIGGIAQAAEQHAATAGQLKNSKWIESLIDKMASEKMHFSRETEKNIAHLMGNNPTHTTYAKTRGQAIKFLAEQASENLFHRYGVERPRLANFFPEEFIETNPARVVGRYLQEASKLMAEIETFGPTREGLNGALKSIQERAFPEYGLMSDLSDMMMGVIDRTRPITQTSESAQRWFTNMTYGVKIGAGFAPIVQVSQPLISFAADAGYLRSLKSTIKIMAPQERAYLRRMGVIGDSVFRKFMGYGTGSRVWDYIPSTRFFTFANRMLDYAAAETGMSLVKDLHRLANRDVSKLSPKRLAAFDQQVKYARTRLKEDFGIDYTKPLGESEFMKATYDYAAKSQLHPDAIVEPKFMNMPSTRWLATLKRFTYKQALNARDMTLKEWKRGNFMPTLRLAANGYFGGGVMIEAKDKLREAMSGKHIFRADDPFWMDLLNRYAIIGTLGAVSDLTFINNEDPAKILNEVMENVEFGAMPVALSDISRAGKIAYETVGNVGKNVLGTAKQREEMTTEEIGRQLAEDVASMLGSYGYYVSGRLQSDPTESKRNKAVYDRQMKAVKSAYWNDDFERATAISDEWDQYAELYPIEGEVKFIDWKQVKDERFRETYER